MSQCCRASASIALGNQRLPAAGSRSGRPTTLALSKLAALLLGSLCLAANGADQAKATFHQAPKPLSADAVTSDWPRFLGPTHNASSPETKLLKQWPKEGPRAVW